MDGSNVNEATSERLPDTRVEPLLEAIPPAVIGICLRLREHGKRGWVVGGCVRDLLMGRPATDWDVATDARPEEVRRFFPRVIPTGIQHGTVTVLVDRVHYEVTTLRGEQGYSDGRRPDAVVFLDDIVEDLARRDFTFNAIAIDPLDARLIDPFDGRRDLETRTLRAVGMPADRFAEDGLRILRAARFAATLGCTIDPSTEHAMGERSALDTFARVSAERVHDEWLKIMRAERPSVSFEIMRRSGMLAISCPELVEGVDCEQNRFHDFDVWRHTLAVLDACQGDTILRVAALLHDVGKPRTRQRSDKTGDYTFYNHERIGAEMAEHICRRLKFSNDDRKRIVELVLHHLICYSTDWSDAAVRRWVRRVRQERVDDLVHLAIADAHGKGHAAERDVENARALQRRVAALLEAGTALSAKDLAIDGHTIMRELGLPPGRLVGVVLAALVELVTEDPAQNEPERLLTLARDVAQSAMGRGGEGQASS